MVTDVSVSYLTNEHYVCWLKDFLPAMQNWQLIGIIVIEQWKKLIPIGPVSIIGLTTHFVP